MSLVCGTKEGAEPKGKALDLPVALPPDPHLWPRAVGSDLKSEQASSPNEFLCCWMCIDGLKGLMVWEWSCCCSTESSSVISEQVPLEHCATMI